MNLETISATYKNLGQLVLSVQTSWPEHSAFLRRSLEVHAKRDLLILDRLAADVLQVAQTSMPTMVDGYRWMCSAFLEEELYFRREGRYRCSTIAEAEAYVYGNAEIMGHYMRGLLLSQILWSNHAQVFLTFLREFMSECPKGYRYLEIGCGHGLFLAQAARDQRSSNLAAWDISDESLRQTQSCLQSLGVDRPVALTMCNVVEASGEEKFDAIVVNEVLEHLEDPQTVLFRLKRFLAPGGRMFIHVPINSPAPDHIFLLRSASELLDLVTSAGLSPLLEKSFPMSGYSLAKAVSTQSTISCVVVAKGAA